MNAPVTELRKSESTIDASAFLVSLIQEPLRSKESDIPLVQLLSAISRYHRQRDLSHQERYGTHDLHSRQAISELHELQELLHSASAEGDELVVEASLKIELAPQRYLGSE